MHIRVNSEAIAFHASGEIELVKTNRALSQLIRAQQTVFNRQVNILTQNIKPIRRSEFNFFFLILNKIFSNDCSPLTLVLKLSRLSRKQFIIWLFSSLSSIKTLSKISRKHINIWLFSFCFSIKTLSRLSRNQFNIYAIGRVYKIRGHIGPSIGHRIPKTSQQISHFMELFAITLITIILNDVLIYGFI